MTSEGQFSLFPERSDQRWSLLHGLEPIASELADFAYGVVVRLALLAASIELERSEAGHQVVLEETGG